jgi:cytoskeletal protein CcmA (bactofilin family)
MPTEVKKAPLPPKRSLKPSKNLMPLSYYGSEELLESLQRQKLTMPQALAFHHKIDDDISSNHSEKDDSVCSKSESILDHVAGSLESAAQSAVAMPLTNIDSYISHGVAIRGNLQINGILKLDGLFEGTIHSEHGSLIVGPNGRHKGKVEYLDTVTVDGGIVTGDINTKMTIINQGSRMTGNITSKALSIKGSRQQIRSIVNIEGKRES